MARDFYVTSLVSVQYKAALCVACIYKCHANYTTRIRMPTLIPDCHSFRQVFSKDICMLRVTGWISVRFGEVLCDLVCQQPVVTVLITDIYVE